MAMTQDKPIPALRAFAYLASLLLWCALPCAIPDSAVAQAPAFSFGSRSFITPFPQTDRYQVHVIGDGLAEGMASGLEAAFDKDGTVKIINSAKYSSGLARPDRTDWAADADVLAKSQNMNVAVVMMGLNDVRNIRNNDGVQRWGTDGWRTAYGREVDRLIKTLKDNNVAVYWVGLPVLSNPKTSEAMGVLNDIFRERTYVAGVKYIDTWNGFTDQFGAFSAYGPDLSGQNKRLREPDGTFFTAQGNRKLANYVEVLLRRDLAAAKAERNIPLAGDDEEQSRLVPQADPASRAQPNQDGRSGPGEAPATAANAPAEEKTPAPQQQAGPPVVQPQLPRQPSFRPGDAPSGETIVGDISSGVTALATVSPINELSANSGERRLPVQERLYYKTLVKGQALKPKPGRADDFKWPRS